MRTEEFEKKRAGMSNEELIERAEKEVSKLAESYGRSHRMTIPPMITDTDMILSEIIKRFKCIVDHDNLIIKNQPNPKQQTTNPKQSYL